MQTVSIATYVSFECIPKLQWNPPRASDVSPCMLSLCMCDYRGALEDLQSCAGSVFPATLFSFSISSRVFSLQSKTNQLQRHCWIALLTA